MNISITSASCLKDFLVRMKENVFFLKMTCRAGVMAFNPSIWEAEVDF